MTPMPVLVVGASPGALALRAALEAVPDARPVVVGANEAAARVARERFALVIVANGALDAEATLALAATRSDGIALPWIVVCGGGSRASGDGVDLVLAEVPSADDLAGLVRAIARVRTVERARAAGIVEVERIRTEAGHGRAQTVAVLVGLLDLASPGAAARGARMAELADAIAARFGVPDELRTDLGAAARLVDLGRVAVGPFGGKRMAPAETWAFARSAAAVLDQLDGMRPVAELIAGIHENWDGTGHPERFQQGQIPLRCRILRVLMDYFAIVDAPNVPSTDAALERLAEHSGTSYDPMVLFHFEELLRADGGAARGNTTVVTIDALEEGMVLAEDLVTDSGLKLLSRNSVLSDASLQVIRRRHRIDPILRGAAIQRPAA